MLSIDELAEFLQVPKQTVYKWNSEGTGPKRVRVGRYVMYRRSDIEEWMREREL